MSDSNDGKDEGVVAKLEHAAGEIKDKVEAAAGDPAAVSKAETVVQSAVSEAPAVAAQVAAAAPKVAEQAGNIASGVVSDVEHAAAVAEAYVKGFVVDVETSVGAVIAALINRVHALEAHLGMQKTPITPTTPAQLPKE